MLEGPLIDIGLPAALFLIMIGMGLTLTPKDFREVLIAPRATFYGLLAQVVLLPVLAFGLALLLGLGPAMAVGLVIIAACPGGTTSNIFAFLGGGDVALSVILTVLASLCAILSLPLFTSWAMQYFNDTNVAFEMPVMRTIIALLVVVVVPLLIGMAIRKWAPKAAAMGERAVGVFGLLVLVLVIIAIMMQLGDRIITLASQGSLAAIALNIVGLVVGMIGGRVAGLSQREAFTVAIELGIKNGTLGLMITLSILHDSEMSVPSAVYGVMMFLFGFLMIALARKLGLTAQASGSSA